MTRLVAQVGARARAAAPAALAATARGAGVSVRRRREAPAREIDERRREASHRDTSTWRGSEQPRGGTARREPRPVYVASSVVLSRRDSNVARREPRRMEVASSYDESWKRRTAGFRTRVPRTRRRVDVCGIMRTTTVHGPPCADGTQASARRGCDDELVCATSRW